MLRSERPVRALVVLILSGALLGACTNGAPSPEPTPPSTSASPGEPDAYAAELVALTNRQRTTEGLEQLAESTCARDAALDRARALVGEGELVHAPLAPVIQDCAPFTTAAENLVNSTASPPEVLDAWLNSPGHRANIVDPALTEIGIGCVPDGDKLLCSQIFLGP